MFKQTGITVLEMLIGLSIMSGVSLYTMKMTEKVEDAVVIYQDSVKDMKTIKEKLKLVKQAGEAEELEALLEMAEADISELDEAFYFEE